MADNAVNIDENSLKDSCKKEEDKPLKGVSGEASTEKSNQDEGRMNNKPSSFTWTGKRKLGPIETSKPLELSGSKGGGGITIKLNAPAKKKKAEPVIQKKAGSVAAAFGNDESDEEEEIPPEAKMRMRNIGKDTPTSAGPNSFDKGKKGFTHTRKVFEKKLNETKPP